MGRHLKNRELDSPGYSVVVPGGSSTLVPTAPVDGQMRFNVDESYVEVYYDSSWNPLARIGPIDVAKDTFVGDGSDSTFNMSQSYDAGQEARVIAVVGNIFQNPGVAFTFDGTNVITFASPPPFGQTVIVLHGYASTDAVLP